jgi:hypothetical protein
MKLVFSLLLMTMFTVEAAEAARLSIRTRRGLPPLPFFKITKTAFKKKPGFQYANEYALYCVAAFENKQEIQRILANKDTNPNAVDPQNGMTALMYAAMHGNSDAVTALMADERVNPDQGDALGYNALMHAVVTCKPDKGTIPLSYITILRALVSEESLNHKNNSGQAVINMLTEERLPMLYLLQIQKG